MLGFHLPGAVCGFLGMHLALRTESADLSSLVAAGADPVLVARRTELLTRVLYAHHTAEDRLLWPALERRQPGFDTTTEVLEDQHRRLDRLLAEMARRPEVVDDVHVLLEEHLTAEETRALPVWLASFTLEEHEAFGRRLRAATPLREVAVLIPWLLDASPDETAGLAWGHLPKPMRAAYRLWWKRAYERRWGRLPQLAAA
jgi:hypothetical protein